MALIDVSELLMDPDFVDACTLIRRDATVNNFGENVLNETQFATVGSVQPASGDMIKRLPEALQTSDVRVIYVKAAILRGGGSAYPDLIQFGTRRFEVQLVMDWLNYGGGWNSAICVRKDPSI